MKTIKLTDKQYEIIRRIVKDVSHNLELRESYTKHLHCSRRKEVFPVTLNWRAARLLQHMKEQFK